MYTMYKGVCSAGCSDSLFRRERLAGLSRSVPSPVYIYLASRDLEQRTANDASETSVGPCEMRTEQAKLCMAK